MSVSQKCQYALRALFELARRRSSEPIPIAEIAQAQAIPPRFLELILGQLRQGGFVKSRRGVRGGYIPVIPADELSVGAVIRFIDGPVAPVECVAGTGKNECPLHVNCAFVDLWKRARDAMAQVYDETTFQDLIEAERTNIPNYSI